MGDAVQSIDIARRCAIHLAELIVWTLCVGLTLLVSASTLAASFPARERALIGEAIVLGAVVVLALLALLRWRRSGRVDQRWPDGSGLALTAALAALRVLLGVPVFLFALVASAAGFAA